MPMGSPANQLVKRRCRSDGPKPGKRHRCVWTIAAVGLLLSPGAFAFSTEEAKQRAQSMVGEVQSDVSALSVQKSRTKKYQPPKMVAEADLHLRTGQHEAAIHKLNQVIELHAQGRASQATAADSRFLLGEAYFADGQLYSARRQFEYVLEHVDEAVYAEEGGRAAGRLVDIALRTQRTERLPQVLQSIEGMTRGDQSLAYARAKALFALDRYRDAARVASGITGQTLYAQRSSYLRGTALMMQAREQFQAAGGEASRPSAHPDFEEALAAFRKATISVQDPSDKELATDRIADLSWMAIGRLHYESGQFLPAIAAYRKISRKSEHFPRALFELAWTYVRMGDYERGLQALEVLMVLEPDLVDAADAALLRGDSMLRSGMFKESEEAYLDVKAEYDPLRAQVESYLAAHEDPAIYYDKLTATEVETGADLPPLAVEWAREEAKEERIFAILDDVGRSRELLDRSQHMVTVLRGTLGSGARAKLFPGIRRQLENVVALMNQLAIARLVLARGMDQVADANTDELAQVREDRRALMARLGKVPTNPGDFTVRETQAEESWNRVSQKLQRIQLEANHLQALINGLSQVLADARKHGVQASPESLQRFRDELAESKKELVTYRKRIADLRQRIEVGKVQSGFGDARFVRDAKIRGRFRALFRREVGLVLGGADPSAEPYTSSIRPLMGRIDGLEGRLLKAQQTLEGLAASQGREMMEIVDAESRKLDEYAARLDTLDESARVLVGKVARDNFEQVQERLEEVVMRADIGLVQKSWEKREEQKFRVRELLRERAREERYINDELREVLDEEEAR